MASILSKANKAFVMAKADHCVAKIDNLFFDKRYFSQRRLALFAFNRKKKCANKIFIHSSADLKY